MSKIKVSCKIVCNLLIFVLLVLIGVVFVTYRNREIVSIETARFILYNGSNETIYKSYRLNETVKFIKDKSFNRTLASVLIIHGYNDSIAGGGNEILTHAYLTRHGNFNVISLDWNDLAYGDSMKDYFYNAVPNSIRLGDALARSLVNLRDVGFNIQKLHMIGISMGVAVASVAAKKLNIISGGSLKVHRITGLDPVMIPYSLPFFKQLHPSDADFVDVIHTDAWVYGTPFSVGTVDFYPNGGDATQPGCPSRSQDDFCSHDRAVQYYAESVMTDEEDVFYAIKCPSWRYFKLNENCNVSNIVSMGFHCDLKAVGDYFLQTNSSKPYSKDMAGAYADLPKMFKKMD